MVSPGHMPTAVGRICRCLYIWTIGHLFRGGTGAGDTPPGVSSFRDSVKEDKGESGGSLWVVMGVLGFGARSISSTRGETGTREALPWFTVFVGLCHGVHGEKGFN